jgi:hypothetical protein
MSYVKKITAVSCDDRHKGDYTKLAKLSFLKVRLGREKGLSFCFNHLKPGGYYMYHRV